jgi:hypothetical protein
MSILSVAKVVQEQYNNVLCEEEYQKEIDDRKKNLLEL